MRYFGCSIVLSAFLLLILFVVITAVKVWLSTGPIEYPRVVLESQLSPNGLWIAFTNEDHFSLGFGGDNITGVVSLAPSRHPDQTIDLLAVETGGNDKERPRITWSGPTTLRATVAYLVDLRVMTLHAQGVEVDLHLDPDDPPAVTAWLREKGLLSEATGDARTR